MRFKRPTKFQTFLLPCLGLFAINRIFFRAPSEAEMIAKFHGNKAKFEQIRLMLQQDKNVATIGDHWVAAAYGPDKTRSREDKAQGIIGLHELPLDISQNRIDLYRSRLKELGFSRVDAQEGTVQLEQFGGGFTDTSWGIGYFYSEKTPKALVKSAYYQIPGGNKRHFSLIEGYWYLYQRR